MPTFITDTGLERMLKRERQATGADRFDEVWDGVYFMPPIANNEHQFFQSQLAHVIQTALGSTDHGVVYAGVNVSDREKTWTKNYRCPDVAVVLPGCRAKNRGTHWWGGPDFVIEIISPKDRSKEKIPFYARVGVRELLLIDRNPWSLELYRLQGQNLLSAGRSTTKQSAVLACEVLPLSFRLQSPRDQNARNGKRRKGNGPAKGIGIRPFIEIISQVDGQRWLV
jgi:Uma2 family endonuclease